MAITSMVHLNNCSDIYHTFKPQDYATGHMREPRDILLSLLEGG